LKQYTIAKSSYEDVNIDLLFTQYEANFNTRIFGMIQDQMKGNLVTLGGELMSKTKGADFEIPIVPS
jgi:hypothetical protein